MSKICMENVCFSYKQGKQFVQVLQELELTINQGEFLCIIGPSGSGKSTLLRLLAGLESPDQGRIRIDGAEITGPGSDRMIVFQEYTLFPWLTAEKNVSFALQHGRKMKKKKARELAMAYLEMLGLKDSANCYPFQLSGGMRQRVAIARALAMDTDILLLDEPFAALDAKNRYEIQQMLLDLWSTEERKTIVFVTHDVNEAMLLADRIIFLKAGAVAADILVNEPRPRHENRSLRERIIGLFEDTQ